MKHTHMLSHRKAVFPPPPFDKQIISYFLLTASIYANVCGSVRIVTNNADKDKVKEKEKEKDKVKDEGEDKDKDKDHG